VAFPGNHAQPASPDVDIPNQAIKFNVGQRFDTETLRFILRGEYSLEEFDNPDGRGLPASRQYKDGKTVFSASGICMTVCCCAAPRPPGRQERSSGRSAGAGAALWKSSG
jgi:hypothetical protein